MREAKAQSESGRMSAHDALLEAGAESTIETTRQRRWFILLVGIVLSLALIIVGGAIAHFQRGAASNIAGVVAIIVGVLGLIATSDSYRKVRMLIAKYDDKKAG